VRAYVNPVGGSPIVAITSPLMALYNVICGSILSSSSSRILMKKRQVFYATVMEASNEYVWRSIELYMTDCVYKS